MNTTAGTNRIPTDRRGGLRALAACVLLALLAAACGDEPAAEGPATADPATEAAPADELVELRWISPRASLEVMDDYNLWVPIEMGYFEELGLSVELIAGPQEATASARFVAEDQADVGYPSSGVLTASIDAGIPVRSIFGMMPAQVFNFALPAGSDITSPEELGGTQIAVADAGWSVIIDPMLVEVGVDPATVEYIDAGAQWGQSVSLGQVDAGLAWEGLRSQWAAQGLEIEWLVGHEWSAHPSNVYSIRAEELADPERVAVWERFVQGIVMGFEFARANPRAAAQITYRQFPDMASTMEPQLALDSMLELASLYGISDRDGLGWGWHYEDGWQDYLEVIADLEQTSRQLSTDEVFTNDLLEAGNDIDVDRVRADAENFELDEDFEAVTVPADVEL